MSIADSIGESSTDLLLSLAHADSDLDQSVGDSLVGTELHDIWSHGDSEFLSHTRNFVKVWLGTEA